MTRFSHSWRWLGLLLVCLLVPVTVLAASWRRTYVPCVVVCEVPAEQAIRTVLAEQDAAWNRGDLEGYMAGYWRSPELTFYSGDKVTRGWQATLDRYRARYQGEGKEMGKVSFSEVVVDVLSLNSALVRGRWKVEKSKETVGGVFTLLMKRLPEGWRIVHDHTS